MKFIIISTAFIFAAAYSFGQALVKIGDKAPKYYLNKLVNAPNTKIDISDLKGKPTILAFWGTWCAPCIPEMINLGKLQKIFGDKVQIIGISNDNEQKLKTFLQKNPGKVWFASDPSDNSWNIFDLQTAGHAVLIDKNNYVVSITETAKIDSAVINNLITANQLNLSENRGTKLLPENQDPVKSDSTTLYSFVLQPALKGITPMMKKPRIGPFGNRRITIINLVPDVILKDAYDISVAKKVIYPTKDDSLKSNQDSYCIDFIVAENDKANLKALFQKELNNHLPVKGEIQKRVIPCYVLKPIEGKQISIKESTKSNNRYSSTSLEFSGEGIPIKTFISYIENELRYPIYDATGLTKYYDMEFFKNNVDRLQSTKDGLAKLGLELVKDQKEMDVLVITIR